MKTLQKTYCCLAACVVLSGYTGAYAQVSEVIVDFSEPAYYPLLKGKASVFQEGLPDVPDLASAMVPLSDLKIRSFRVLTNQGARQEVFLDDGIHQVRKNEDYETFIRLSQKYRILPMLTIWGTPEDLRRPDSASRVEPPVDYDLYGKLMGQFVKLYMGDYPLSWEIWNEPQNKNFFASDERIRDYNKLYAQLANVIRETDPDALIVGPGLANEEPVIDSFNQAFVENILSNDLPIDYYSIHSYGRYAKALRKRKKGSDDRTESMIESARRAIGTRFQTVPLVFTEYEFYPPGPKVKWHPLREYTRGAVNFLYDLDYFLEQTDIPFVTWNRYLNKSPSHRPGGLVDHKQKRRPIYHAFRIYGEMPTERKQLIFDQDNDDLGGFASADNSKAGILLWNNANTKHEIKLSINRLPHSKGTVSFYRIDEDHASYMDGGSDECSPVNVQSIDQFQNTLSVELPGPGIVYLKFEAESSASAVSAFPAKYIRSWQWAGRTENGISGDYGDFDWRTWAARIGVKGNTGRGLCGVTIDETPAHIKFNWETFKLRTASEPNSSLGIRIDYILDGESVKSVLFHGTKGMGSSAIKLPWPGCRVAYDEAVYCPALIEAGSVNVDVQQYAPEMWRESGKKRTVISFWIENTGVESQAVINMSASN